jgi:hypothetical protein
LYVEKYFIPTHCPSVLDYPPDYPLRITPELPQAAYYPQANANTKNALRMPNRVPQYHHLLDNRPAMMNAMTANTERARIVIDHTGERNLKPNKRMYDTKRSATPTDPMLVPVIDLFIALPH